MSADRSVPAGRSIPSPKRVDLHVHTIASSVAGEAALRAIQCPECYSDPLAVYEQASARGMDFVAVTDHDTIDGALQLADRRNVIVGEELTCFFPEDRCKIHLLVFGIDRTQHEQLQERAHDIYQVAEFIERHRVPHSVAHPLYRQNDRLEREHLERLILLFKGFECLNGAHSALHRESLERVLNELTRQEIQRLAERHNLLPRWPEPWFKARTGGSDDHGLVNVGRTWTEFPADVTSIEQVLDCLRDGACQPGGEAGSTLKLAHAFYAVGVRYATGNLRDRRARSAPATRILRSLIGERGASSTTRVLRDAVASAVRRAADAVRHRLRRPGPKAVTGGGTELLARLFGESVQRRIAEHPALSAAIDRSLPPLGEHEDLFRLLGSINRDVASGIADVVEHHLRNGNFMALFDVLASVAAQQFVLAPHYFALFHQNKERELLPRITNHAVRRNPDNLRVGLFTDTFDDINGVARFIRDMSEQAHRAGRQFTVCTSTTRTRFELPNRVNFEPMFSRPMPYYADLQVTIPPLLHMLEFADRKQFDVIHVSTPGPVGLVGWLAARMLRVPVLMTYHTDFPAYVENLTKDHRLTAGCSWYMGWFYRHAAAVFSRSQSYQDNLRALGVAAEKLLTTVPGINTEKFNPSHRDESLPGRLGMTQPKRLFYCGRISVEKNLPLLVETFKRICARRNDVALVVAGDGPYAPTMRGELRGLPAYLLGFQTDAQLAAWYATSDLFVFPSRTDTLGQVVMEAQASGLPAIVSDEGGPKETVADQVSGLVLPATDPDVWADAIDRLLDDEPTRQRFSRSAVARSARYSLANTFEQFWNEHLRVVQPPPTDPEPAGPLPPRPMPEPVAV